MQGEKCTAWTQEEVQLLVKAVKLHPAGTVKRWEAIAVFINSHSSTSEIKTSQQVISKVKMLKNGYELYILAHAYFTTCVCC